MILAELNYDIHNKELFMIVIIFQIWRVYVEEVSEITIFIDYKNLVNFCTIKKLNWQRIRWLELFLFYKFRIKYRSDKDNSKADILSKRSDIMDRYEDHFHSILWQNKNDLLGPNGNILVVIVIIKSEIE